MQRKAGRSITQLESTNIGLPRMPALIRYLDPHAETWKTIKSPSTNLAWAIEVNGDVKLLEFERVPEQLRPIMRNVMHHALVKYAPSTTALMFEDFVWLINVLGLEVISAPLSLEPLELRQFWITDILPELIDGHRNAQAPKFYLKFLCKKLFGAPAAGP